MHPFKKYVKTLNNKNLVLNQNKDQEEFDEEKYYKNYNEKIVVDYQGSQANNKQNKKYGKKD